MNRRRTPPVATAILWLLLPREEREFLLGDLEERFAERRSRGAFRAWLWYWLQVVRTAPAALTTLRAAPSTGERRGRPNEGREVTPSEERKTLSVGIDSLRLDVRYAIRILLRGRGFTAGAAITLALGIGVNTALFSAVDSTLLCPLPFENPDELVRVSLLIPPEDLPRPADEPIEMVWSFPKYRVLREHQDIFSDLAVYRREQFTLTSSDQAERVRGEVVGGSYFSVLGLEPELGRAFLPEEDATQGTHYVVMIGHGLWVRGFGSDPGVIGRTIHLDGIPHTIVGVAPEGFNGLRDVAELWVPSMTETQASLESPGHSWVVVARLLPYVTPEHLATRMAEIGAQVDEVYPSTGAGVHWSATAHLLDEYRVSSTMRTSLLLLFAAAGLVLLVACVNVAGLLLSRGISRGREIATRMAVGASRGRLLRQLLIEGLFLSILGGGIGLALALTGVDLFNAFGVAARFEMRGVERLLFESIRIDASAMTFCLIVVAVTPLLFSLLPALGSSRLDLAGSLKASHPADGPKGSRMRRTLVVTQVALAFVLMVGSGLMLTTVRRLNATDMGFEAETLLSVRVIPPAHRYELAASQALTDELVERVRGLPGVEAVSFTNCAPLADGCRNTFSVRAPVGLETAERGLFGLTIVSPGYFDVMGVPVLAGRPFGPEDREDGPAVTVISESAASRLWPGEDPLGKQLPFDRAGNPLVIGVVGDVRLSSVESTPLPEAYLPTTRFARREGHLLVRTSTDPLLLMAAIRAEVQAVDRELPIFDVRVMSDRVSDATWRTRFNTVVFLLFALLTLALAGVGLFGAQSYVVARQTRAIGVRVALGASRWTILSSVVGGALTTTLIGILVGLGVSLAVSPSLQALLYETDPREPGTFGLTVLTFLAVAVIASYLPARRAASLDPGEVLRAE